MTSECSQIGHVINHPWPVVAEAFWRGFPTHDLFPELVHSEIVEKSFDERNSQAVITRKCYYSFELPALVKRFLGTEESGFRMMQRIDICWQSQTMKIESWSELEKINLKEELTYMVHVTNSDWTNISLRGSISCDLMFGLQQYVERFCRDVYTTKMQRTFERDVVLSKEVAAEGSAIPNQAPVSLVRVFANTSRQTMPATTPSETDKKTHPHPTTTDTPQQQSSSSSWRAPLSALQGLGSSVGSAFASMPLMGGFGAQHQQPQQHGESTPTNAANTAANAHLQQPPSQQQQQTPQHADARNISFEHNPADTNGGADASIIGRSMRSSVQAPRGSTRATKRAIPGGIKPSFTPLHVFGVSSMHTVGPPRMEEEQALFTHYQTLPEHRQAEVAAAMSKMVMF